MSTARSVEGPVASGEGYGPQYSADPHGDPPAPARSVYAPGTRRSSPAVVLLIVAGVSTLIGLFFAVPAVVLGILGVIHQRESPTRSAKLTRWGWIAYVIGAGLMLLAGVALMLLAGYAASGNN